MLLYKVDNSAAIFIMLYQFFSDLYIFNLLIYYSKIDVFFSVNDFQEIFYACISTYYIICSDVMYNVLYMCTCMRTQVHKRIYAHTYHMHINTPYAYIYTPYMPLAYVHTK